MLSLLLTAALSGLWDDETFLGRGPTAGAGAAVALSRHLSAEAELAYGEHHRDAGYLQVDGNTATATARLSFAFRDRNAAVRPFVSGGASWIKSTDVVARIPYKTSLGAWELGAGLDIRASDHWRVRPEARWTMTASDPSFTPGGLEPPLLGYRAGIALVWQK